MTTPLETNTKTRLKRSHWHDYHEPCIYLVTVTTVDREPLLVHVEGDAIKARIKLSPIGKMVWQEIEKIPTRYPQVKVMQHQIMPDHVHLVLRVTERLPEALPLGNEVASWKAGCSKATSTLRDLKAATPDNKTQNNNPDHHWLSCEATFRSPDLRPSTRALFAKGFNDSILTGQGQLHHMMSYVRDNPRRLLIKRQHSTFFAIHRSIRLAGTDFDAVGNLALLRRPLMAVHCRRHWTETEQQNFANKCLAAAESGTVLIGAFISSNEKIIYKVLREKQLPLIHIVENGFNDLYKPVGQAFYATAEGNLLQLAPWPYRSIQSAESNAKPSMKWQKG